MSSYWESGGIDPRDPQKPYTRYSKPTDVEKGNGIVRRIIELAIIITLGLIVLVLIGY
jgi:hypothetical protein